VANGIGFESQYELAGEALAACEGGRLVIGAWAGSVNVSASSSPTIRVGVRARGLLPPPELDIQRDGSDVYVALRAAPILDWLPLWAWRNLQLEVSVPASYSVEVRTRRGRVDVRGIGGEVDACSQEGHLIFRDVQGPIDARTQVGSIDVSGCGGDVDVATARGSIEIENVEGQVSAHSRGGPIRVLDPTHGIVMRSGGGSVQIEGLGAMAIA
jgi:hypothetical protein